MKDAEEPSSGDILVRQTALRKVNEAKTNSLRPPFL